MMQTSRRGLFGLFASLPFIAETVPAEPLADEAVLFVPEFIVIGDEAHTLFWSAQMDPTIW